MLCKMFYKQSPSSENENKRARLVKINCKWETLPKNWIVSFKWVIEEIVSLKELRHDILSRFFNGLHYG